MMLEEQIGSAPWWLGWLGDVAGGADGICSGSVVNGLRDEAGGADVIYNGSWLAGLGMMLEEQMGFAPDL